MQAGDVQSCPRRMREPGPWEQREGLDRWDTVGGLVGQPQVGLSCSFCGSLHPDRFMELVEQGWIVEPTDKPYKAYLARPRTPLAAAVQAEGGDPAEAPAGDTVAKFYYPHLHAAHQETFIALYNDGRMRLGYPGHFHVLPYFASPRPHTGPAPDPTV